MASMVELREQLSRAVSLADYGDDSEDPPGLPPAPDVIVAAINVLDICQSFNTLPCGVYADNDGGIDIYLEYSRKEIRHIALIHGEESGCWILCGRQGEAAAQPFMQRFDATDKASLEEAIANLISFDTTQISS